MLSYEEEYEEKLSLLKLDILCLKYMYIAKVHDYARNFWKTKITVQ